MIGNCILYIIVRKSIRSDEDMKIDFKVTKHLNLRGKERAKIY